mmetsp:Transcript_16745/g.22208  ORF Transcript_16745/g.22208 Transcript_16745/m.22208 type:complete len:110 (+) Transcript_16745:315-644(+)
MPTTHMYAMASDAQSVLQCEDIQIKLYHVSLPPSSLDIRKFLMTYSSSSMFPMSPFFRDEEAYSSYTAKKVSDNITIPLNAKFCFSVNTRSVFVGNPEAKKDDDDDDEL